MVGNDSPEGSYQKRDARLPKEVLPGHSLNTSPGRHLRYKRHTVLIISMWMTLSVSQFYLLIKN